MNDVIRMRVLPALEPIDGKNIEIRTLPSGDDVLVQTRYVGDVVWATIGTLPPGADGADAQLRNDGVNIQWKQSDQTEWTDLVALDTIIEPALTNATAAATATATQAASDASASQTAAAISEQNAADSALLALENATQLVIATQPQAVDGDINDKGMTPLRTRQQIEGGDYQTKFETGILTITRDSLDLVLEPRKFKEGVGVGSETADTDGITMAWAYATNPAYFRTPSASGDRPNMVTKGPVLYLREGEFKYGGTGLPMAAGQSSIATIAGAGQAATRVSLASGGRLIDAENGFVYLEARDMHIVGGDGAIRLRSTAVSANRGAIIERLTMSNYGVCAIEDNSQDNPYFKVRDCIFVGRADADTIGLSITGYRAGSAVEASVFLRNRYHLKLAPSVIVGDDKGPATPINVIGNDFIRNPGRQDNGLGANTFGIWIVPNADTAQNAGRAILMFSNKHGNENAQAGDAHILVADEGSGTYVGDRKHVTTASTGYLNGIAMQKDNVNFAASPRVGFIKSYTSRLMNFDINPIWDNNTPDYVCEYMSAVAVADLDKRMATNLVSFAQGLSFSEGNPTPRLSNIPGTWNAFDPLGYSADQDVAVVSPVGSDRGEYVNLLTSSFAGNNATLSVIADEDKNPNGALEVTASAEAGRAAASLAFATIIEGRLAWIEASIKQGSTLPVDRVRMRILDSASRILLERVYRTGPNWRAIRVPYSFLKAGQSGLSIRFEALGFSAGVAEKFQVGQISVYHGSRPFRDEAMSADNGDASATLLAGTDPTVQIWNSPITGTRSVTLATSAAYNNAEFEIIRTAAATGAFNLNVGPGPLKALTAGTSCRVKYSSSLGAWLLSSYSTL